VSCNGIGGGVASCRGIGGGVASCRGIGGGIALHAAVLRIALLIVLRYFSACCSAACVTAASFALVQKNFHCYKVQWWFWWVAKLVPLCVVALKSGDFVRHRKK